MTLPKKTLDAISALPRLEPLLCESCHREGTLYLDKRPPKAMVVCKRCLKKCFCAMCGKHRVRLVAIPRSQWEFFKPHTAVCQPCWRRTE